MTVTAGRPGGTDIKGTATMNTSMKTSKWVRRFAKTVRDFALGLGLFAAVSLPGAFSLFSTAAHARRFEEEPLPLVQLATPPVEASKLATGLSPTHHMMVFVTLAVAFATLFALNLWFARHVRRVHASSRRQ